MKSFITPIITLLLVVFLSCNDYQATTETSAIAEGSPRQYSAMDLPAPSVSKEETTASEDDYAENLRSQTPIDKKKIIKDGTISAKSRNVFASKRTMDTLLKTFNAYYEREDFENNERSISYDLTIRISSDTFEKLISALENGEEEVITKSIQARDVTEEYIDIETRLANKRDYLQRYKELLSKAITVKDIIAVEENIRNIQEEIESKEGRLKYLNDQISYSTLHVRLFKEKEYIYKSEPKDSFPERVKKSLATGWNSIIDFILWMITVWPYIVVVLILLITGRYVIKKRRA